MLRAVAQPRSRTAVRSCHASGKSFTCADAALWWTGAMGGITIVTAPKALQVKQVLFGEMHRAYEDAAKRGFPLGGRMNQIEWAIGPQQYVLGMVAKEGVRFHGWHGSILIIGDEAAGIPPTIFEAMEGIRSGGDVRFLLPANPTISSGSFYDIFAKRPPGWNRFIIDGFATPNFRPLLTRCNVDPADLKNAAKPEAFEALLEELLATDDDELAGMTSRPYLIQPVWAKEKFYEWGTNSPMWVSRVRGDFPPEAPNALLSLTDIERAGIRKLAPDFEEFGLGIDTTLRWDDERRRELVAQRVAFIRQWIEGTGSRWQVNAGIDVAGPGEDETAVYVTWGPKIVDGPYAWTDRDCRGKVIKVLDPWRDLLKHIKVDSAGMGEFFAQHLRDSGGGNFGERIVDVNVGVAPRDKEHFNLLKSELYWAVRMRFRAGDIDGLEDETTMGQLAGILYAEDERGRVIIEPKVQAAKRGVGSPDRAEALMLCLADLLAWSVDEAYHVVPCPSCGRKVLAPPWAGPQRCPGCGGLVEPDRSQPASSATGEVPRRPGDDSYPRPPESEDDNPFLVLSRGLG